MKELAKEEREEARSRSARNHDGLYLRVGIDAGYASDSAKIQGFETRSHGFAWGLDLAVGATSGILTTGWEFLFVGAPSPSTTQDGFPLTGSHTAVYSLVGFLMDVYPNPRGGLHFTSTIGVGVADINPRANESTHSGFGLLFGGGYDWWVSDAWSTGLMARVLYLGGERDDFGSHHVWIPLLTGSALWH